MSSRNNRGASYMDNYDRGDNSYGSTKSDNDLTCCESCAKHLIFWINLILSIIGLGLIIVACYAKFGADSSGDIGALSDAVLIIVVIAGIMIVTVSVLGCCGATTHSICLLVTYIILLIFIVILEIVVIVLVFDESYVKRFSKQQWKSSREEVRNRYQNKFDCCGFNGPNDNPAFDCDEKIITNYATSTFEAVPGCYDSIKEDIESYNLAIGIVSIILVVYESIMLVASCCLCCKLRNKQRLEDV